MMGHITDMVYEAMKKGPADIKTLIERTNMEDSRINRNAILRGIKRLYKYYYIENINGKYTLIKSRYNL